MEPTERETERITILPSKNSRRKKPPSLHGKTIKVVSQTKTKTLKNPPSTLALDYKGQKHPVRLDSEESVADLKKALLGISVLAESIGSRPFEIVESLGDGAYAVLDDSARLSSLLGQGLWIRTNTPKASTPKAVTPKGCYTKGCYTKGSYARACCARARHTKDCYTKDRHAKDRHTKGAEAQAAPTAPRANSAKARLSIARPERGREADDSGKIEE